MLKNNDSLEHAQESVPREKLFAFQLQALADIFAWFWITLFQNECLYNPNSQ